MEMADREWVQSLKDNPAVTPEQINNLGSYFIQNQAGNIQQSIICEDQACPYFKGCPLYREKIPRPSGKPCPVEETFKAMWFQNLAKEMGVNPDGYESVDLGIAVDIVNTMIDIYRAQSELVNNPEIAERVYKGTDKDGTPIVDLKMNPVIFSLKSSRKQKAELLSIQVATREARAKDKSRQTQDAAQLLSQMREAMDALPEMRPTRQVLPTPKPAEPDEN